MDIRRFLEDSLGTYTGIAVDIDQTVIDVDIERERDRVHDWARYLRLHGDRPLDRMLAMSQMQKAERALARLTREPPNRSEIVSMEVREGLPLQGDPESETTERRWRGRRAFAKYTVRCWREPVTAP